MFPKPQRLPSYLVTKTISQGKRVMVEGCDLRIVSSSNPISRFTVVIPISTHKRAVKRNYLKRCIRESVRSVSASITKPCDGVFFGRKELMGKTQPEIEKIVRIIFRKLGCIE